MNRKQRRAGLRGMDKFIDQSLKSGDMRPAGLQTMLDSVGKGKGGGVFILQHHHDDDCPVLDGAPEGDCTCSEVEISTLRYKPPQDGIEANCVTNCVSSSAAHLEAHCLNRGK